jgi:hypothetical protein
MKINRSAAAALLAAAEKTNPGAWIAHSHNTARAAEIIAAQLPDFDPERAFVFGLLHDIGRAVGVTDNRHILDGYHRLMALGDPAAARICLTHSFPIKDARYSVGEWDVSPAEFDFIQSCLGQIEYDGYDHLIQLCDAITLAAGFCLLETRLVDVSLRRGVNEFTLPRWRAQFALLEQFNHALGRPVYDLLPGVIETTFQCSPSLK